MFLDEGEDPEPGIEVQSFRFHLVVVAGELDLVTHGEGAPGVDAVLHQRLFQVVLPGLAGPLLPGGGYRLGGVDAVEGRRVEGRGRGQRGDEVAVGGQGRSIAARSGVVAGVWIGPGFQQGPSGRVLPMCATGALWGEKRARPCGVTYRRSGKSVGGAETAGLGRLLFLRGGMPAQVQGPVAVQWVGPGSPEERAATTGDRNWPKEAAISANEAGT